MRTGSLFSGYSGLDLAVNEVLGSTTAWHSDIDKGACKILAHRYPDVPNLGDITTVDWSRVEPVDVLTGGFPCQDVSAAGRRAGIRPGTRSGLWSQFAYAISQLRPRTVVIENVRGLLSAKAHSDVEPCPWCVGDDTDGSLRALGAVLGDLASLGFDAEWRGLLAADVGAPHGRFRVFIVATAGDADKPRLEGHRLDGERAGERAAGAPSGQPALLPTPSCSDTNGAGAHGDGGADLRTAIALLPTPNTGESLTGHGRRGGRPGNGNQSGASLDQIAHLLPTPAVNDMGEGKTPEHWDEWTAKMQAAHGNGNGHGKSLSIEAQRLLPTPNARDWKGSQASSPEQWEQMKDDWDKPGGPSGLGNLPTAVTLLPTPRASDGPDPSSHGRTWSTTDNNLHTVVKRGEISNGRAPEAGPGEDLRDVRDTADPEEVCERSPGGQDGLPQAAELLAGVCEHEGVSDEGLAALAGEEAQGADMSGLWDDGAAARPPRGPEPREQRPREPDDALRELPPETALAGGPRGIDWGPYSQAIRRWELILGRPAPPPTILSAKGTPQLSARFVEFLMGLPAGWVTDVPGITRNEALRALGNGVVPQQCAAALRLMLGQAVAAPAAAEATRLLPTPNAGDAKQGYVSAEDHAARAARKRAENPNLGDLQSDLPQVVTTLGEERA